MPSNGSSSSSRGKYGGRRGAKGSTGAFRGRGRGRGGARGGGREGFRGGRGRPIFDSARLVQQTEENATEDLESEAVIQDEDDSQSSPDSEEDEEPAPLVRSYAALIQSFAGDSAPQAKKRKLDPIQEPKVEKDREIADSEDDDIEDDAHPLEQKEEGPEMATEDLIEVEDEEEELEDVLDPFEAHFANPDNNILTRRLKLLQQLTPQWTSQKVLLPQVGKALFSLPQEDDFRAITPPTPISEPTDLRLKHKLAAVVSKQRPFFNALEKGITPFMFNYQDILFCERNPDNSEDLRRLICLHAVNHLFKTRDRILKNNARLAKEETNDDIEARDQGFTRPKVLIILPTRQSCVRMVNMITSICEPEQQENRKRFDDSYLEKEDTFAADKPKDFRELFGGNDDDMFRLGLKFTRKTVKYFSQFYNSDIIFASPLGLRMALEGTGDKKGEYDFLSSIEMVLVDQADALLMQNWDHMEYIFEHLNLQPKEAHGCDFSRVRNWYLDNNAKYFRQTITLAAFNTPELNTMFYNQSKNWAGKVKINASYSGAIQELGLKVKQTFSRLESPTFAEDPDARFTYFTTAIIPSLTRRTKDSTGTVVFIPSYLDFVRVRNYLATNPATSTFSFGSISEYTSVKDVARARSHFFNGRHHVLLYTERAHHFRRYQLRGVKRIIMYGLPDNPIFYKEVVGSYVGRSVHEGKLEPGEGSLRVLFSKWDLLKLERIAGTERLSKMMRDKGDTFEFL